METTTRIARIAALADRIETETRERFVADGMNPELHETHAIKVTVKPGKKYTKIDVGSSGKYMVTEDGEIFGIKTYGVIHWGHQYGTVDTINEWDWSGYTARKKVAA